MRREAGAQKSGWLLLLGPFSIPPCCFMRTPANGPAGQAWLLTLSATLPLFHFAVEWANQLLMPSQAVDATSPCAWRLTGVKLWLTQGEMSVACEHAHTIISASDELCQSSLDLGCVGLPASQSVLQ